VSIHTGQDLAAEEDRHRPSLQTTVDKLGELVERFRALTFNGRDRFFQHIIAKHTTHHPSPLKCCGERKTRSWCGINADW